MGKQKIVSKIILLIVFMILFILIIEDVRGELTACTKTTDLSTNQICKIGTYEDKDAYFKKLASGGIWCIDENCNQVLNCKTVTIGTETYYTDSSGKGHSTMDGTGCPSPTAVPIKGAIISSENIFVFVSNKETTNFRYEPEGWSISKDGCVSGGFLSSEEFENNGCGISIIPQEMTNFEGGVENICQAYAEDKVISPSNTKLFAYGEDIPLPPGLYLSDSMWYYLQNIAEIIKVKEIVKTDCINHITFLKEENAAPSPPIPPEEEEHEDLSEIGEGAQEVEGAAQAPNSQLCEIDSVWITAGTSLNIEKAVKTLVFTLTGWQPFDEICKPKAPATAAITTPSGKKYAWSSQYDLIINNKLTTEMKNNGFDLNLIKALFSHESAFHSQAISTAGCIGLMQICYSSVPSATPAYQKTTCCEAGEDSPKQTCTSEVKKTKHLWQNGVYLCNPNNDDRFDPNKNIAMGLELLSKKYAQCNSVNGALSAYASGSCSSRLDYAETIQSIKNSHKNE